MENELGKHKNRSEKGQKYEGTQVLDSSEISVNESCPQKSNTVGDITIRLFVYI